MKWKSGDFQVWRTGLCLPPRSIEPEKKGCGDRKGKGEEGSRWEGKSRDTRKLCRQRGKSGQHRAQLLYAIQPTFPLTVQ